jgi:parallel beta-helix repeat protein
LKKSRRWLISLIAPAVGVSMIVAGASAAAAATPAGSERAASFSGFSSKDALKADGRSVVADGQLPVVDGSAPKGHSGHTYYVDSVGGDDGANGLSPATAWRSLGKVSATQFGPGDRILLKAGSSWSAEGNEVAGEAYDYTQWTGGVPSDVVGPKPTALLAPQGSGTAARPIVLSSYGNGSAPVLGGRGVVNDVVQFTNQQHWDISNLDISNVTDGFDATTFQPAANVGQVPGEQNPKTGDLRGIHVQGENAGTLAGYTIHHVFIHDVSGVTWSVSGAGLDRSKRTGGILFEGLKGDAHTVTQFTDIDVTDNVIANTSFGNVVFKQFSGMGTNRYKDVAPGWGDRAAGKATSNGTVTADPDWRPLTKIEISGNYLTNRDTQYGWDSLYLTSVQGATVENNMIDGAGVSGIEMYYSDNIVVQNNELAELEGRTGAADSNAIDPDRGTTNALIQGNYIHNSGEGILLCGFGFGSSVVRYNIIEDIDRNYVNPHGDSGVNVVYNNLFYNTVKPLKNNTVGFFESSGTASSILRAQNAHYILNNVFVNARADVAGAQFRAAYPGVTFSNNAYSGPQVLAATTDPAPITADPMLGGNPAARVAGAAPTSSASPLLWSGTPVDLSAIAGGFDATGDSDTSQLPLSSDFLGTALTTPPTVGPIVYRPTAGSGLLTGLVTSATGDVVAGATVTYRTVAEGVGGGVHTVSGSVRSNADGRYVIEAPVGTYALTAASDDSGPGAATQRHVSDGRTLQVDLVTGGAVPTADPSSTGSGAAN